MLNVIRWSRAKIPIKQRVFRTIFGRRTWAVSVGDALGNRLVPLLFTPAPEETNDHHGHVVAAHAASLRVRSQAVVHHVLANLFELLLGGDSAADEFDDGLRGLAIPDA